MVQEGSDLAKRSAVSAGKCLKDPRLSHVYVITVFMRLFHARSSALPPHVASAGSR